MSGMERPDAAELLDIARTTLQDVAAGLEGEARFKALMVINAMTIAGRAIVHGPVGDFADAAAVCVAIRSGAYDDDAAIVVRLRDYAEQRCRISSKPRSSP